MRYDDGSAYYTVAEVAKAVGLSAQTIREWERQGHFASHRSPGGHRMYTESTLSTIRERALQRRRQRTLESGPNRGTHHPESINWEWASIGARLRAAREDRSLSQAQVAQRAGLSRTLLSSIERGLTGASMNVFSRLADVLDLPMSAFAPPRPTGQTVMRKDDRPETVLAHGVRWQELAAPGHHLAPAIMHVDAGSDSGGYVTTTRENFVLVMHGQFDFELASPTEQVSLGPGDSLVLSAGRSHAWKNRSTKQPAQALWVELLAPAEQDAPGQGDPT